MIISRKLNRYFFPSLLPLILLILLGCEEPFAGHELLGKWKLVRMNWESTSDSLGPVPEETHLIWEFKASGDFTFLYTENDEIWADVEGTWSTKEGILTITFDDGEESTYEYLITVDTLRLTRTTESYGTTHVFISEHERQ